MHQTLLKIRLPDGERFWPDELRLIVAAEDQMVSPALMGRGPDGKTLSDPPVRFTGGRGWVGLVANGTHDELLFAHMAAVMSATSKRFGQALPVQVEHHEIEIRRNDAPKFYRATNVAIKRRSSSAREEDLTKLCTQRFGRALVKQALSYGLDCPELDELEVANVSFERSLGMGLKTDQGQTGEFVTLLPVVTFSTFADLKGFWFIGNLSARGYGRIAGEIRTPRNIHADQ